MLLSRKPRFITSDSQNSPIFDAARVDGWTGSDLWFGDAMEVRISYSTTVSSHGESAVAAVSGE